MVATPKQYPCRADTPPRGLHVICVWARLRERAFTLWESVDAFCKRLTLPTPGTLRLALNFIAWPISCYLTGTKGSAPVRV